VSTLGCKIASPRALRKITVFPALKRLAAVLITVAQVWNRGAETEGLEPWLTPTGSSRSAYRAPSYISITAPKGSNYYTVLMTPRKPGPFPTIGRWPIGRDNS